MNGHFLAIFFRKFFQNWNKQKRQYSYRFWSSDWQCSSSPNTQNPFMYLCLLAKPQGSGGFPIWILLRTRRLQADGGHCMRVCVCKCVFCARVEQNWSGAASVRKQSIFMTWHLVLIKYSDVWGFYKWMKWVESRWGWRCVSPAWWSIRVKITYWRKNIYLYFIYMDQLVGCRGNWQWLCCGNSIISCTAGLDINKTAQPMAGVIDHFQKSAQHHSLCGNRVT